ncbi:MAG: hypothetical protein GX211_07810 [Clostridiaceae bacterium]|nr:hypothetical protein [Clostridiaceae bacterium]
MQKRNLYKKTGMFLMLILIITFINPSSAGAGISDTDVSVIESDGQITLQWQDPDNSFFARVKITGAGKTVYVEKGVQQAVFADLINGIEYSFRLSIISDTGVILDETVVFGIPRDETPPGPVSNAYGIPDDGCVLLKWNDPVDNDLDRIRITGPNGVIDVDKGVERLLIDGLDNGTEYRFVITALDTSGNESEGVEITSVPEAGIRIHLSGPVAVKSGQSFSVTMDVYASRTDIYAIQAVLEYDADYFQYLCYDGPENITVVRVDDNSEGSVRIFVAGNGVPITGQGIRMITLNFKAENAMENYTGCFRLERALAGTAPPGEQIPVASNSINITISRITLPEVSDVIVLPGNSAISLAWIDPPGNEYDRILVIVNETDSYIVAKGQQSITIPDLINGEVYQFVLKTMDSDGNTSQGITITGIPGILGDVNYDGVINAGDLAIAAYNYMTQAGDPEWEQARHCDVTGKNGKPDGIVDILDIIFIAKKILEQP